MHENLLRTKEVHQAFKGLAQDYVFAGGAVSLYAKNHILVAEIRPTDDADIVVELASYKGYVQRHERNFLSSNSILIESANKMIFLKLVFF